MASSMESQLWERAAQLLRAQHRHCPDAGEQLAQQQMPKWSRSPPSLASPSPGSTSLWPLVHAPRYAPHPFQSPCTASSQLLQTREPSSLCLLLLLFFPLPRSGGRAQLGLSVPEKSTGKWEWLVLLPARLCAREALALSPKPGTLGMDPRPAWGRRGCWCCSGPLGSLRRGCFPSKQHCSTHTRRDLQCREKPPTRHAAACGQGAELGAAVLLFLGSRLLLLLQDMSWPIPGSGTLTLPGGIMETLWVPCPEDRALPCDHAGDALLPLGWGFCHLPTLDSLSPMSRDRIAGTAGIAAITECLSWSPRHGEHHGEAVQV